MKAFYLFLLLGMGLEALAQENYFTPENKKKGLRFYKQRLYQAYPHLTERQEGVSLSEMEKLITSTKKIVEESFSRAFQENPGVKAAFEKDVNEFLTNKNCQQTGNDCRAHVMALSIYYYDRFRPDIPYCKGYATTTTEDKEYNHNCELELKYRKSSLQGVHGNQYGMSGPGTYKQQLTALKNNTTSHLLKLLLDKEDVNEAGLYSNEAGEFYSGIDPEHSLLNFNKECMEQKVSLYSEFVPVSFDVGRNTVGQDQVEPVKAKILNFIKSNPEMIVTNVLVVSSSSKTPFYTTINGKKVIDPKSDERNLSLAKERENFAKKALHEVQSSSARLGGINFETRAQLAGPDFRPMDLNERFVTKMTPGYVEKLEALYKKYQIQYEEEAVKGSFMDLLDEKQFVNLYQAKFKPFHGFRINIRGLKKEDMKCPGTSSSEKPRAKASKQ